LSILSYREKNIEAAEVVAKNAYVALRILASAVTSTLNFLALYCK